MLHSYAGIFLEKSWLVLPFRVISICETRSETAARVPIWKSLIVRNASQLSASRITEHISFDYGTTQRGINCPELVHQSRKEGDSPHHHMPERVVWTTEDCANASSVTNFRRNERMCSMNVYFQSAWVGWNPVICHVCAVEKESRAPNFYGCILAKFGEDLYYLTFVSKCSTEAWEEPPEFIIANTVDLHMELSMY